MSALKLSLNRMYGKGLDPLMTYPFPNAMPQNRLGVPEAPDHNHNRLIGVEITFRNANNEQVELEMFACKHTLPMEPGWGRERILVTLHLSGGDRQAEIYLR